MVRRFLAGLLVLVPSVLSLTGCLKEALTGPDLPKGHEIVPVPAALPPVTSDIILYQYLMSDTPLMNKLSLDAKEELLSSAQFELRGFWSTGNLHREISEADFDLFLNYAVGLSSTRGMRDDFNNPLHPLAALFSRMTPETKTRLISSGQYLFHGFASELKLRREFSCSEYKAFYDYLMNTNVSIVVLSDAGCPCMQPDKKTRLHGGIGEETQPCLCGTKMLKDKVWDQGSTWSAAGCKEHPGGGCLICADCPPG